MSDTKQLIDILNAPSNRNLLNFDRLTVQEQIENNQLSTDSKAKLINIFRQLISIRSVIEDSDLDDLCLAYDHEVISHLIELSYQVHKLSELLTTVTTKD